jgi:hypothetical protein
MRVAEGPVMPLVEIIAHEGDFIVRPRNKLSLTPLGIQKINNKRFCQEKTPRKMALLGNAVADLFSGRLY